MAPLTVGLAIFLFILEIIWLKTNNPFYYRHARFWSKIFLLNFSVGVVTGIPLEFSFGTNWNAFSVATGNFFGNILGFETVLAFMLEAGFLGVMIFGWGRVPRLMHLFATAMVVVGSTLSVFWILVANSWMQTPAGVILKNHQFVVTNYYKAIFTPDLPYGFGHMFVACLELSMVVVAGISALYVYRNRHTDFFMPIFRAAVFALVIIAPTQILIGDSAGQALASTEPAKLAAIEAHWHTNPPGHGAAWALVAWPDAKRQDNRYALTIPDALSLIVTHSRTGTVLGLTAFPKKDQPPVWIPFYGFRIMVMAGVFIAFIALWTLALALRRRLSIESLQHRPWLLRGWLLAVPAAYIAIEAGWFTREEGRQPWLVYGLYRTLTGVSHLTTSTLLWSLTSYAVLYTTIGTTALYFARRLLHHGPDLTSPIPLQAPRSPETGPSDSSSTRGM